MTHDELPNNVFKLRRTNTSGYQGVSWHKGARKWGAYIRANGVRRYLGLFKTAGEARAAYDQAAAQLREKRSRPDRAIVRDELLGTVMQLYNAHGIKALSTPFLEKQKAGLYHRLLEAGLRQLVLLSELGLSDQYRAWRNSSRTYRGVAKPKWSWEIAVARAKEIKEREGDLPTVAWFRTNGYSSLTNTVHASGRTWEDLRKAVGCSATSNFYESRNGMRWRSRPEASLSNFLYARGIEHRRGERYAAGYSEQSGRRYGRLDMHFLSAAGVWVDVEVWGDPLNGLSGGRYQATRAFKETWQAGNPNFLGIPYRDCLSDVRLTEILTPLIGVIDPFRFDKPVDRLIETSHWSNADELLATCAEFAAQMPDGTFPSEDWLRKRGRYAARPGPTYNTLAIRVNQWLGGTRKTREILGHGHASTINWTPERAIVEWRDFEKKHGITPSQSKSGARQKTLLPAVAAEGGKIYEAARRLSVLAEARGGGNARKLFGRQSAQLPNGKSSSESMDERRHNV